VLHWHGPTLIVLDSVEPGREQLRFALPGDQRIGEGALRVPFSTGSIRSASGTWIDE
jgi:hypothetical protein